VIGPLALGLLITFVDWRTALQIWAIPGLAIGLLYALFGAEDGIAAPQRRDYRRALWEDVLKNKTVFSLVAVSTFRAMGQTALSAFLPLYLSLHLKLSAGVAGAYISLLYFFAGVSPAFVGWISDRFGHKSLIAAFSFSSVAVIVAIPHLGSGPLLAVALAALGALLWALRPVIVTAAMEAAPQKSHRQHRGGDLRSQHGSVFSRAAHGRRDRRCLWPPGGAAGDCSLPAARSRGYAHPF
jgi:predicted MFS family arabinose efflux permease